MEKKLWDIIGLTAVALCIIIGIWYIVQSQGYTTTPEEFFCGDGMCKNDETAQNCPEDCIDCGAIGEQIRVQGGPDECCVGLTGVGGIEYQGECPEFPVPGGVFRCTDCGNGICDTENLEDKCNCPKDCERRFEDLCVFDERGFHCTIYDNGKVDEVGEYCKSLDSSWGPSCCFCPPEPINWDCDYPYSDAGKKCLNSEECEGRCLLDRTYAKTRFGDAGDEYYFECEDCEGACEKYPLFSWFYELNDGEVYYDLKIC